MSTNWRVIFWVVVLGILAIVGGVFGIQYLMRSSHLSAFKQHLAEYTARPAAPPAAGVPSTYVKGKVVPVQFKNGEQDIDWIYFQMPRDLRADKPEEVGTVVWLEWGEKEIDKYDDGASAYVHTCKVSVIDKERKLLVGQRDFQGSDPPMEKSHSGAAYGSKPDKDIINYLTSLPRQ